MGQDIVWLYLHQTLGQGDGVIHPPRILVGSHQSVQRVGITRIGCDGGFVAGNGFLLFTFGKEIKRGIEVIFCGLTSITHEEKSITRL